ncbi:Threonine/homoserine/homoserine lactone efflux protein [Allopseudospirillum japonicum]|uniref:Threonine/homoserine/homoserine lactone efflux protein n=1 Tax=Allopseudospirillum japonicum TaxID=64971 RepID=A0A1H6SCT3_9GAMM|nr:LysE family translocator [Allopseudospirillum japonicum]SEI61820.1 Threonine/homoserine/homoserine lactone efflux protein [Allopseudospirillum japonicum]
MLASLLPVDVIFGFLITALLLCLAPGPDNLFVIAHSASQGYQSGLWITLGLCSGLIFHTSAVALGIAGLLQTTPWAFLLLKILGAAYLIYLAWQTWQTAQQAPQKIADTKTQLSAAVAYRRGLIMNLTNPKVSLFFLALLPQFIPDHLEATGLRIYFLGGLFLITALVSFSCMAVIAARLGQGLMQSKKIHQGMQYILTLVFVVLAAKLLV